MNYSSSNRIISLAICFYVATFFVCSAQANEYDARNFLTVATGSVPSKNDPLVQTVQRQLEMAEYYCTVSNSGYSMHDRLAKAHSLLRVQQSLLELLVDFVRIAKSQCTKFDSGTLTSLYVLERDDGASHFATVERLIKNPQPLIAKWRAVPPSGSKAKNK